MNPYNFVTREMSDVILYTVGKLYYIVECNKTVSSMAIVDISKKINVLCTVIV